MIPDGLGEYHLNEHGTGLDDDGPYTEEMTDGSRPANIYAEHKLEMEQRVLVSPSAKTDNPLSH